MALTSLPENLVLRSFRIPLRVVLKQAPRSQRLTAFSSVPDTVTFAYEGILHAETPEELRQLKEDLWEFIRSDDGFQITVWDRPITVRVPDHTDIPQWPGLSDLACRVSFTCVAYDPYFFDPRPDSTLLYHTP